LISQLLGNKSIDSIKMSALLNWFSKNKEPIEEKNDYENEIIETNPYNNIINNSIIIISNGNYKIYKIKIKDIIKYLDSNFDYQRKLIEEHVNELMESIKKESYLHGIISLAVIKNKIYIIDGQHRIEAIKRLLFMNMLNAEIEILIEIAPCLNNREALEYYKRVNLSTPISEQDIIKNDEFNYMERFKELFIEMFPNVLRDTTNCLVPYINFNKLKDKMINTNINNLYELDSLMDILKRFNEDQKITLEKRYSIIGAKVRDPKTTPAERTRLKTEARRIEEMRKIKCYLRDDISYDWLNTCIERYQ
jgi:hypothetical protein